MTLTSGQKMSEPVPGKMPRHVAIIMDGNGRWRMPSGICRVPSATARALRRSASLCARQGISVSSI